MPELKGFFIIKIGDCYFVSPQERTMERDKAYYFFSKNIASRLAEKVFGTIEVV